MRRALVPTGLVGLLVPKEAHSGHVIGTRTESKGRPVLWTVHRNKSHNRSRKIREDVAIKK